MRVAERFGVPMAVLTTLTTALAGAIAVLFYQIALPWWYQHLEHRAEERKEQSAFITAQIEEMKQQTTELKKLGRSAEIERVFEAAVLENHEEQTEAAMRAATNSEATKELMVKANELMEPVPELRREELKLLQQILTALNTGPVPQPN